MPNLELYKIFVEVAKEKNITKASENLNISQPAVTRHIKNLENELNTILFTRTKGMELTEAGKRLFQEIAPSIEKIIEVDKKFYTTNEIVLGTYATMLSKVLSSAIAEFYSENKTTKIVNITDNSKLLKNPLQTGEFDILVIRKYDEDEYDKEKYKFISLGTIEFKLIANNDSKLSKISKKRKINLNDLNNNIVYIPRGNHNSTDSLKDMIEKNKVNAEIKRIDSISMVQIIQQFDNCVGEANTKYLAKEIEQKLITVLNTSFEIEGLEFGIYYRRDNTSAELKKLIKKIKENF